MSLTDATYFQGELNIPNTDQLSVQQNLGIFIDKYENQYLDLLLGSDLRAAFLAGLALDPVPQQWTDLKNQIWVVNGSSKTSPVANYVYFYFARRNTYGSAGTGFNVQLPENATPISSMIETSRAWNDGAKQSFTVYKFLKANESVYGPLYYDLRFLCGDWLAFWFDWSYWWSGFPINYRRLVPEIFRQLNASGI